jgi:hypothetical protein
MMSTVKCSANGSPEEPLNHVSTICKPNPSAINYSTNRLAAGTSLRVRKSGKNQADSRVPFEEDPCRDLFALSAGSSPPPF